jgi:hypothetical protein
LHKQCPLCPLSRSLLGVKRTFEGIIDNPIKGAVRAQVTSLGKELYKLLGNTDAMREICNDVAARNPKREGWRLDIIDKAWDGVGAGNDRWWS